MDLGNHRSFSMRDNDSLERFLPASLHRNQGDSIGGPVRLNSCGVLFGGARYLKSLLALHEHAEARNICFPWSLVPVGSICCL